MKGSLADKAFEKANKLEEIYNFINENKIICPSPRYWGHFANKIGFSKECEKFESQEKLYQSDFWDNCRPLILSSSDETLEKKYENFINLINYFYDKSTNQRLTVNWLILRNPIGEDYWVKKSK